MADWFVFKVCSISYIHWSVIKCLKVLLEVNNVSHRTHINMTTSSSILLTLNICFVFGLKMSGTEVTYQISHLTQPNIEQ